MATDVFKGVKVLWLQVKLQVATHPGPLLTFSRGQQCVREPASSFETQSKEKSR